MKERMMIMSARNLGILVGIIVGIILTFVILKAINKDGKSKTKYDERQQRARGEAYKYGFFTVLIANALMMCFSVFFDNFKVLGDSMFFIPILAGVIVQVTYSIFNDAYVGLNTNMTRFAIFMFAISVLNFGLGIRAYVAKELLIDGVLQAPFLNVLCGALFVIIAVELLIKHIVDAREE